MVSGRSYISPVRRDSCQADVQTVLQRLVCQSIPLTGLSLKTQLRRHVFIQTWWEHTWSMCSVCHTLGNEPSKRPSSFQHHGECQLPYIRGLTVNGPHPNPLVPVNDKIWEEFSLSCGMCSSLPNNKFVWGKKSSLFPKAPTFSHHIQSVFLSPGVVDLVQMGKYVCENTTLHMSSVQHDVQLLLLINFCITNSTTWSLSSKKRSNALPSLGQCTSLCSQGSS